MQTRSVVVAILALCGTALANPATVVFANNAHAGSSGKDAVPGMPGMVFTNFGEAYGSSGSYWVTAATISGTGTTTATDQVVVVGNGATFSVVAREGVTAVGSSGQLLNLSGLAVPRINENGDWAIAFTPAGDTHSLVVKSIGGVYSTLAVGGAFSTPIGDTYGLGFASAAITSAGKVAFLNDNVSATARTALIDDGSAILAREGMTSLDAPEAGGEGGLLFAFSFSQASTTLHVTPDGATSLYLADVLGSTTLKSVILNNRIMMQVGQPLTPHGSDTISAFSEVWLESDGTWFVKGTAGGSTFVSRNGVEIARIGSAITPGSSETWTTLTDFKGDASGNYVLVGSTSATASSNDVVVFNGTQVISREADPVDMNGDGVFTDGVFIHSYRDRCFLSNDGYFYVGARLKNSASTTSSLGANVSMIRIPIPVVCLADFNQDGGVDGGDVEAFFNAWENSFPNADMNQDGGIDGADVEFFFGRWEAGC